MPSTNAIFCRIGAVPAGIMEGTRGAVRTLLADPHGAIRDPAVSWDGQRMVFAWKKSLNEDDYHLYELDVASGQMRQMTFGAGVCGLRAGVFAEWGLDFCLDALRADGGLLVDRGEQPLSRATRTDVTCAGWGSTRCIRFTRRCWTTGAWFTPAGITTIAARFFRSRCSK